MDYSTQITVAVGSKNPSKLKAAENGFKKYFPNLTVHGFDVPSGVRAQPLDLDETTTGACNRAKAAFEAAKKEGKNVNYSIGIESGLVKVHGFPHKYLTGGIIAIYDGKQTHVAVSPMFEIPEKVSAKLIADETTELARIFDEILGRKNINHAEGVAGIVSKGKHTRDQLIEVGVTMALAPIVSKEMFQ